MEYSAIELVGKQAKAASRILSCAAAARKNVMLRRLAALLTDRQDALLEANALDVRQAVDQKLDAPRLDRLKLTPGIISDMASACLLVAEMPDPVGALDEQRQRPNGLLVGRMRVPLGVVAMIYESRPNVTIDAAILCLKAGNAVILRGGSEAFNSNMALAVVLQQALEESGLPAHCAQLVGTTERSVVNAMCKLDQYIDVIIPRGGEELVRLVAREATMPVLKHDKGVCHIYVDDGADIDQAVTIIENSKVQRPGVCNALECMLVHKAQAARLLPLVAERLSGVEFRACPISLPLLGKPAHAQPACPDDWGREFGALILAVRVVDGMDEALEHIAAYGSHHTEIICTNDHNRAMRFVRDVDASMTGVNAATRFNDGGQLGLGAEIGISTSKLHAYGPMGVRELTTTKFVVMGTGQVRE
jgi:glutamate-5-semialdehyde dehydrogenase